MTLGNLTSKKPLEHILNICFSALFFHLSFILRYIS
uniref:Uncharacterized protein n=1 Tax=Anguilla anguilla TaxID=7936 RepID=A0A0E9RF48_ANGAN